MREEGTFFIHAIKMLIKPSQICIKLGFDEDEKEIVLYEYNIENLLFLIRTVWPRKKKFKREKN